jgi:murein DD-endopeptidase MepM/ murein hydrolase activator NlpD
MRPASRPSALLLLVLVATAGARAGAAPAEVDLEVIARDLVRSLADGRYEAALERFAPAYRARMGKDQLAITFDPLREQRGHAKSVIARLRHDQPDGVVTFTLKCNWLTGKPSDVVVALEPGGAVVGVRVADEVSADDEAARDRYETRARLRPPFHGTWVARNAARDSRNPHWVVRSQKYAVDWVRVEGGKTYRGDGKKNEDYLAYGQEALAPADGTVVVVVDGVPEGPGPGAGDAYFLPGNHLAIDLGGGEFAMLQHLLPGSITVKVGDRVKAGQPVARVGASGNASEPQLHFQLCDRPRLTDCAALPCRFSDVTLDGKRVARALPTEGSRLAE